MLLVCLGQKKIDVQCDADTVGSSKYLMTSVSSVWLACWSKQHMDGMKTPSSWHTFNFFLGQRSLLWHALSVQPWLNQSGLSHTATSDPKHRLNPSDVFLDECWQSTPHFSPQRVTLIPEIFILPCADFLNCSCRLLLNIEPLFGSAVLQHACWLLTLFLSWFRLDRVPPLSICSPAAARNNIRLGC